MSKKKSKTHKSEKTEDKKVKDEKKHSKKHKKEHGGDHKEKKKSKKEKKEKKRNHEEAATTVAAASEQNMEIDQLASYIYKEHPSLTALPQSTIDEYLKKNEVDIQGDLKLRPILEFSQTNLPESLLNVFAKFANPTPIQAVTWPISLSGRDIVGIAETGSGKTYAFTVPGLVHISSQLKGGSKSKKPTMLVLSPTRELAMQSDEQASAAGKAMGISTICLYGGVPKDPQVEALKRGVDIVVATPGRLMDLIDDGACDLSEISFLVLDEADRMLDDGFERDIRKIIEQTPSSRQTLMFSATWPASVRKLAADFLKSPIRVTIGSDELAASQNVKQIVEVLDDPRSKTRKLMDLLKKIHASRSNRVLIFALYKKEAVRIEEQLLRNGYKVIGIHGDKSQQQRTAALNQFKSGSHPLMVATDVAARGLDIPDVEYVINVTFPLTIEAYIHRIGRTGRGGKKGTAYTFFTVQDKAHSGELVNVLKQANMPVPDGLLKFGTSVKKKTHSAYGAFFKDTEHAPKATKIVFDNDD